MCTAETKCICCGKSPWRDRIATIEFMLREAAYRKSGREKFFPARARPADCFSSKFPYAGRSCEDGLSQNSLFLFKNSRCCDACSAVTVFCTGCLDLQCMSFYIFSHFGAEYLCCLL